METLSRESSCIILFRCRPLLLTHLLCLLIHFVCLRVCLCILSDNHGHIYIHPTMHTPIHIYVCVLVLVRVWVWVWVRVLVYWYINTFRICISTGLLNIVFPIYSFIYHTFADAFGPDPLKACPECQTRRPLPSPFPLLIALASPPCFALQTYFTI